MLAALIAPHPASVASDNAATVAAVQRHTMRDKRPRACLLDTPDAAHGLSRSSDGRYAFTCSTQSNNKNN